MGKKILVTGGTGFIGANLIRKIHKGNTITAFALSDSHPFLKGIPVKIIKGDLRDYDAVRKAMKGQDEVYHLAASTSNDRAKLKEIMDMNVKGTGNVLLAAEEEGVKGVVYVGSGSALGFSRRKRLLCEKDHFDMKDNIYAQSKYLGEQKVEEWAKKGLRAMIVLPGYVMGEGEVDPVRFGLMRSINENRIWFTYPGGGSIVDVEDLADGIILAMKKGRPGERYGLSVHNTTLFDFYNLIARFMGKRPIRIKIPGILYYPFFALGWVLGKIMPHPPINAEVVRWHFTYKWLDNTKARTELGWKPKHSLDDTIKRTIAHYRKRGILK